MQFIHTTNPYDDSATTVDPPAIGASSNTLAPQPPLFPASAGSHNAAAHGLNALSAAATSHQGVASSAMTYMSQYPPAPPSRHSRQPLKPQSSSSGRPSNPNPNLNMLLNPTIDPSLQHLPATSGNGTGAPLPDAADQALADLLRNFKQTPGSG